MPSPTSSLSYLHLPPLKVSVDCYTCLLSLDRKQLISLFCESIGLRLDYHSFPSCNDIVTTLSERDLNSILPKYHGAEWTAVRITSIYFGAFSDRNSISNSTLSIVPNNFTKNTTCTLIHVVPAHSKICTDACNRFYNMLTNKSILSRFSSGDTHF